MIVFITIFSYVINFCYSNREQIPISETGFIRMSDGGTVRGLIEQQGERFGAKPFLIFPQSDYECTYSELRSVCRGLADSLLSSRIPNGGRTALLLDNSPLTVQLFLGALYGGFVPVALNPTARPSPAPEDKGWRSVAKSVRIHSVPGHHGGIMKEPHVRILAEDINKELRTL